MKRERIEGMIAVGMMLALGALAVVMASSICHGSQCVAWEEGPVYAEEQTPADAVQTTAIASEKPCVAVLTAKWCGPCSHIEGTLESLDGVDIRFVDIDLQKDLAAKLFDPASPHSVPQLVLCEGGSDGPRSPRAWLVGEHSADQIREFINQPKQTPRTQALASRPLRAEAAGLRLPQQWVIHNPGRVLSDRQERANRRLLARFFIRRTDNRK